MNDDDMLRVMQLHRDSLHFTVLSLGFCVIGFVALFAIKKDWFVFWLLSELGYIWAWRQARKCTREAREIEYGGGRSNRN